MRILFFSFTFLDGFILKNCIKSIINPKLIGKLALDENINLSKVFLINGTAWNMNGSACNSPRTSIKFILGKFARTVVTAGLSDNLIETQYILKTFKIGRKGY